MPPASDMFYTDEPDGTPHPATVGESRASEMPEKHQLSGLAHGDELKKSFELPESGAMRVEHDFGPDS